MKMSAPVATPILSSSASSTPMRSRLPVHKRYSISAENGNRNADQASASSASSSGAASSASSSAASSLSSAAATASTHNLLPLPPQRNGNNKAGSNPKRATWNGNERTKASSGPADPATKSSSAAAGPRIRRESMNNAATASASRSVGSLEIAVATAASSSSSNTTPSPSASPLLSSPSPTLSASLRDKHAAYLASIVSTRNAKLRDARRAKPSVKERLSSTFTMSRQMGMKQQEKGKGAASNGSASSSSSSTAASSSLSREDSSLVPHLPRVFSILGGSSVDVVRHEFLKRGWIQNTNEWSSTWSIQWSIVGRVIDHTSLSPHQIVNHFQRAHVLTSKTGLCKSIHDTRYNDCSSHDIFPRCYPVHVHDREDLEEFRLQFRRNAVLNIVQRWRRSWRVENEKKNDDDVADLDNPFSITPDPLSSFSPQLLQYCLVALQAYLRTLMCIRDGLDNNLPVQPTAAVANATMNGKKASSSSAPASSSSAPSTTAWSTLTEEEWLEIERASTAFEEQSCREHREKVKERATAAKKANGAKRGEEEEEHKEQEDDHQHDESITDEVEVEAAEVEQEEVDERNHDDEEETKENDAIVDEVDSEQAQEEENGVDDINSDPFLPTAAADDDDIDSIPSVALLNLLTRTPFPDVSSYYTHFTSLLTLLRTHDSQHFLLSGGSNNIDSAQCVHNLWIIKPGGLSRGRGIQVCNSYSTIHDILQKGGKYVIQRYIERPLLLYNKKFDIRQWVLLVNFNNVRTVYFFSHSCYFRFSSRDYTPYETDAFVHLTNNSIQKYSEEFDNDQLKEVDAKGNMWSTKQFVQWMERNREELVKKNPQLAQYSSGLEIWTAHIQPMMHRIARLTLSCGQDTLELRNNSFSLYGFDYMLSQENLQPWLIEVNSSPTLVGIAVEGLVEKMVEGLVEIITQDEWSCVSEVYKERVEKEKERLKKIAEDATSSLSEETSSSASTGKRTTSSSKQSRSSNGLRGSSSSTLSTSSSAASTSTTATASATSSGDPFLLPTPHPVGHRVGGWEVIESSFIGIIPKAWRIANEQSTKEQQKESKRDSTVQVDTNLNESATAKKKSASQPTGLFVTGRAIVNPATLSITAAKATKSVGAVRRATNSQAI